MKTTFKKFITCFSLMILVLLSGCSAWGRINIELVDKAHTVCENHEGVDFIDTVTPTGPTTQIIKKVVVTCNDGEIKRVKL